jgi:hypothetical protein
MTESASAHVDKPCVRWCTALLVVAAMSPLAHAEGGLPGSPRAIVDSAPLAVSSSLQ